MVTSDPMRPRMPGLLLVRCAFIALASVAALGCYHRTAIKPTELPVLNESYAAPVDGDRRVMAVGVAHVEKPDGTLVEVRGEFDVYALLDDETELKFAYPVRARLDPSETVLILAGAKEPERRIPLEHVASVEVSQFNGERAWTALLVTMAGVGFLIAVISR
jgi:hypothetical protein